MQENHLTVQVLRVISNACTDDCLYTLDIYRGGPDNFEKWFQKNVPQTHKSRVARLAAESDQATKP